MRLLETPVVEALRPLLGAAHPLLASDKPAEDRRLSDCKPALHCSDVTAFEKCPRHGLFSFLGIRGSGRSPAMDKGTFAHVTVRGLILGQDTHAIKTRINWLAQQVVEDVERHEAYAGTEVHERLRLATSTGLAMGLEAWRILRPRIESGFFKVIGSEVPVTTRIRGLGFGGVVSAQLDTLLEDRQDRWHILDLKTLAEGEDTRQWKRNLDRRLQPEVYPAGLRAAAPNREVKGCFFLGIQKPTIRQKIRPPESLEEYTARVGRFYRAEGDQAERASAWLENPPIDVAAPECSTGLSAATVARFKGAAKWLRTPLVWSRWPIHEKQCMVGNMRCPHLGVCNQIDKRIEHCTQLEWDAVLAKYTCDPDPLDAVADRTAGRWGAKPMRLALPVLPSRDELPLAAEPPEADNRTIAVETPLAVETP